MIMELLEEESARKRAIMKAAETPICIRATQITRNLGGILPTTTRKAKRGPVATYSNERPSATLLRRLLLAFIR